MTPQKIASIIASALRQRGIETTDPTRQIASRRTGVGRGHRVREWVITITGQPKPILVIVRIADTRPTTRENQYADEHRLPQTIDPDAISQDSSYSFDASGLPLKNER
jgi:hypothetical protein